MRNGSPNTKAAIYSKMLDHFHNYNDNEKPDYTPIINLSFNATDKPQLPITEITAGDLFKTKIDEAAALLQSEEEKNE
jgi:hypothetical protein